MFEHLEPVYRAVDRTIAALARKRFPRDPVLSAKRSRQTSIVSSALKRHGPIMELTLRESLASSPDYLVWREAGFIVSQAADQLVSSQSEEACLASNLPYVDGFFERARSIQIDVLAYDRRRAFLGAYEFKRGHGYHDAGKIRQTKRDLRATAVLLKSFGERRGLKIDATAAKAIFYYGARSIGAPWGMTGAALDAHFAWPVCRDVEEATRYFKVKLDELVEGADDDDPAQPRLALEAAE